MSTEDAIMEMLQSPNVLDSNLEMANIVDVVNYLAIAANRIAESITVSAAPGHDATGGNIGCVTEALMGHTSALVKIAEAIDNLAEAVRSHK